MAKPFAWSFSSLTRFETCPKQFFHIHIAKDVKDEDSDWSKEGKVIHDALFKRVIKKTPLPLNLRPYECIAAKFDAAEGEKHGEMKLALNRNFEPVDYFAPDVWVRVVIDLLIVRDKKAILVDWKTGKVKDDFTQLGLTACVVSRYMPELDFFTAIYVWLKSRNLSPKNFTISKLTDIWNNLLPRVARIETALKTTDFPARQSPLCNYCPVKQCPHNGVR